MTFKMQIPPSDESNKKLPKRKPLKKIYTGLCDNCSRKLVEEEVITCADCKRAEKALGIHRERWEKDIY